jgi:hypothetical protein
MEDSTVIVLSPLLLLLILLPLPLLKTSFFTVLLSIKPAISKAPSRPNSLLFKLSTLNPGVSMIQASSGSSRRARKRNKQF